MRRPGFRNGRMAIAVCIAALALAPAIHAQSVSDDTLPDLSLEELTHVNVTSVNRKTERANDVAAAVFVITQDDIRRSGATSIPEALRLVPGLQVAQIDGNKWAISARGFNSRFANRLLVLMDGRPLYTLTFGGVFWDAQSTMLDNIERIEVVRGPGGALWGSNAFNGVINIITKSAAQTGNTLVTVDTGTNRPFGAALRVGNSEGTTRWRAFAKGFVQNGNTDWLDQDGHDDWREGRLGARADIQLNPSDTLQVSGEAYRGRSGMDLWNYATLPTLTSIAAYDHYEGAFGTLAWTRQHENAGQFTLHGVVDYTNRDSLVFDERRTTFDLDFQHNLAKLGRHDILWGVGVRYTGDGTRRTAISVIPAGDSLTITSGFIQDELDFWQDELHVTVGGKIEHSKYIGTQFMPNLRARVAAGSNTILWAAISRGVRSGSRLERNVLVADAIPSLPPLSQGNPFPAPLGVEIWGDPHFSAEKLWAYELGARRQLRDTVSIDIAAYYNDYMDMRGVRLLPLVCTPGNVPLSADPTCVFTAAKIVAPMQYTNLLDGSIWGVETTVTWNPMRNWRLVASYSYLDQQFQNNAVDFGLFQVDFAKLSRGLDANHQWTLRSSLSLNANWDWDVLVRHVGALPAVEIDAYTELNTRIAWRPTARFELSLTGENLLHAEHQEFVSDFVDLPPTSIKRSAHLQARWSF